MAIAYTTSSVRSLKTSFLNHVQKKLRKFVTSTPRFPSKYSPETERKTIKVSAEDAKEAKWIDAVNEAHSVVTKTLGNAEEFITFAEKFVPVIEDKAAAIGVFNQFVENIEKSLKIDYTLQKTKVPMDLPPTNLKAHAFLAFLPTAPQVIQHYIQNCLLLLEYRAAWMGKQAPHYTVEYKQDKDALYVFEIKNEKQEVVETYTLNDMMDTILAHNRRKLKE
jgi:hypothetical protein